MTHPKVLILSYYFPPMNGPVTQHPTWFLRYLPTYGLESHIVSSSVFYGENVGAPIPSGNVHSVPSGQRAMRYLHHLSRAEFYVQGKLRVWEHGFAWARAYGINAAAELIRAGGVEAIVSVSPSIASHWAAYKIKQRFPALKWIADFTDPFLGNPFRNSRPFLIPYEKRLEQSMFATADHLGANTNPARDLWMQRYPQFAAKFTVFPNGYDPEELMGPLPLPPRPVPVLAHAGAIYGGRIPNALFQGLFELAQSGQITPNQLRVEFLGSSDLSTATHPEHLAFLEKTGFIAVRNEYVPRKEALRFTSEANWLLLLDITAPHNTKLQVPSKIFDYIRIGRPILAFTGKGSPSARILEQSNIEHVVIPNEASPQEVREGILRFLTLPQEPKACSDWVVEHFNGRSIAGRVASLVRNERPVEIPLW